MLTGGFSKKLNGYLIECLSHVKLKTSYKFKSSLKYSIFE